MIVRVVVLIAVVLAVLYLADALKRLQQGSATGRKVGAGAVHPAQPGNGRLVGCASCGVHVPASRALWVDAPEANRRTAFCSPACRRAGATE